MTDMIDFIFYRQPDPIQQFNPEKIYGRYQFQKNIQQQSCYLSQTRISDCLFNVQQIESYQKVIPFFNHLFWDYRLLLLIRHMNHQVSTEIKILSPKGNILKVLSQYHRTYLYRRFLEKDFQIVSKIHPQTGEISLSKAFSFFKIHSSSNYEMVAEDLLSSVSDNEDQIVQIINLIQNKDHNTYPLEAQQRKPNIHAFIKLCAKKSNKQNKVPFQNEGNIPRRQILEQQGTIQRKSSKSRTYGGNRDKDESSSRVEGMSKYLNNPLMTIDEIWENKNLNFQNVSFKREVQSILGNVQSSLVRKDTPLKNFQLLKLPEKQLESIVSSISLMKKQRKSRQITKIQKNGFGKITVQIQIRRYSAVQKTYKFLSTLPPKLELSFINNYFCSDNILKSEEGNDVIIQLAIRRQQLLSYLESNRKCISFSTKLRILSQLICSTYLLENKCSTLMTNLGMQNFSVAKNIMIKLNDLQYLKNLTQEDKIQFQQEIKLGFIQNQVNISQIYSKIFYQKDLIYVKPSKNTCRNRLSHIYKNSKFQEKEVIIDKIYEECGLYGPKKLMTLLTCIFIPYIPMVSFEQLKNNPPCKNLKWGIASLVKILENIQ